MAASKQQQHDEIRLGDDADDLMGARLIESYRSSKRTRRTSYSLDYGPALCLIDDELDHHHHRGLKESRVSQWLRTKPSYVSTSVREREGFRIEPLPTFTYNDRMGLRHRNNRRSIDASGAPNSLLFGSSSLISSYGNTMNGRSAGEGAGGGGGGGSKKPITILILKRV